MKLPVATYRIQFREGMTFARAQENLVYLKRLGVSHVYASPVFTATAGSAHGYDVTDANEIDPALGGREGFDRFVERLKALELGLILDIVPNHMAASTENAWWRDVLRNGRESAFSGHFDIDWSQPLTLPHLERPFADAVAAGEVDIVPDEKGGFLLGRGAVRYPLSAESLAWLKEETGSDTGRIAALARSPAKMAMLHERQHWRLIPWREASRHLSYRRFFEVTGLVGLRVEEEKVFSDTHRLVLELVRRGDVQGLRIDHVDGLADPAGYLDRLRKAVGEDVLLLVEKILGPGEVLPADWPVAGTTGYEFIEALRQLFTSCAGREVLEGHYRRLVPALADYGSAMRQAKNELAARNFAGEVVRLADLASRLLPEVKHEQLVCALRALLVAFPVYRTYGTSEGLSSADVAVLDAVLAAADRGDGPVETVAALFCDGQPAAVELRTRFQQLTGPVMAKAVEDTLFYRRNLLLAENEVGCHPGVAPGGIESFHALMAERVRSGAHALSATSTHDTKRGEDARARLYAVGEYADLWASHVARWREMNAPFLTRLADGAAPEPNIEWMLYQALLGIVPEEIDGETLVALRERFCAYALKAVREAKTRTDWATPDEAYEAAVDRYARALLSPENRVFLQDFATSSRPFVVTGHLNGLAQTLLKIAAPGIPDFYQGAEGFDVSLVDPDNRRPVDYRPLHALSEKNPGRTPMDMKFALIRQGLALRRERPALFNDGAYLPLRAVGKRREHVLAFARCKDSDFLLAAAPVRMGAALAPDDMTVPAAFWEDTRLELPADLGGAMRDVLDGRTFTAAASLFVADLFRRPVCLLARA